jgi:hypothetical protein
MKQTAVEKIIAEIDNEVDFLKTHQYIAEVQGRMIGLAFAKRVALELKELEKEYIVNAHYQGYRPFIGTTEISEQYYNETFKQQEQ